MSWNMSILSFYQIVHLARIIPLSSIRSLNSATYLLCFSSLPHSCPWFLTPISSLPLLAIPPPYLCTINLGTRRWTGLHIASARIHTRACSNNADTASVAAEGVAHMTDHLSAAAFNETQMCQLLHSSQFSWEWKWNIVCIQTDNINACISTNI